MRQAVKVAMLAVLALASAAQGRIKLVALPQRAATVIRLDNPAATLIEEERVLTLQEGVNQVDFSWKGVSIDMDSIRLVVLSHPDQVTLLNVSYPPNEAALVWEIGSGQAWEETVRISYLLSNIDRLVSYKALADQPETQVDLKSYLILRNFSGEDFDLARVQLDYGEAFEQGIAHEETKQLLFFEQPQVPIAKVWTFDAAQRPWDPEKLDQNVGIPVSYRIFNDEKSGLGQTALWGGKARLFQDDGHESTIFLGEDVTGMVPVGEKTELYIGDSRDIKVTQRMMEARKTNVRRDNKQNIVLYDQDVLINAQIENFKDQPAVLTVVEHIPGQWEMLETNLEYKRKDAFTLEYDIALAAQAKQDLVLQYRQRNIRPGQQPLGSEQVGPHAPAVLWQANPDQAR
jgi:hypothetical protein